MKMVNQEKSKKNLKDRKKLSKVLIATLNDAGWFSMMYFWWILGNDIAVLISMFMVLISDILLILYD